ncbi:MAG: hypothetical protein AB7T49_21595 [Oligoflexales bacterium]
MGFFKSIGNAIGKVAEIAVMPATLPLDFIASKAGNNVIGNAAAGLSSGTKIIGSTLQGQSAFGTLSNSFNQILPAASLVGGAAIGAPGLGGGLDLGFNPDTISGLTDLFGNNTGVNPVKGAATYQTAAPATPMPSAKAGSSNMLPILAIGGLGLVATVLVLRKGKK